jgi:hypothetical protein
MARQVTLSRSAQERIFVPNRGEAFRLRVEALYPEGLPAEIFAHQKRLIDPATGETGDEFCFVCSPFDLTIYPANEPEPTQFPQFFRKSVVDILLGTQALADDLWRNLQQEVNELISALNKLDVLGEAETVLCNGSAASDLTPLHGS